MDVLRRHVAQVDGIDLRGDALILRHARHGHDIVDFCMVLGLVQPYGLLCLEQPRAAGYADGLQGGRHGQADGLLCPAGIRHQQIGADDGRLVLQQAGVDEVI